MALIRATGKHRRPTPARCVGRRAAAGVAGLAAAGVVGSLTTPALAADASSTRSAGLTQAVDLGDSLADRISEQAAEQQAAVEKAKAEAAAKKRAAEVKKRAEEAKRKAAAERAEQERAEQRAARAAEERREKLLGYVAPVDDASVSTGYQATSGLWSSGSHSGIDFQASMGTPVQSVAAGEVVEAGFGGSYGNNIVIKHNDGTYTQYGHLSSLAVSVGQSVTSGQQIGLAGSTGNSTGPHLHFEARTGADYGTDIDPLAYLRDHGVSL